MSRSLHAVPGSVGNVFSVDGTFLNKDNGNVRISGWSSCFDRCFRGRIEEGKPASLLRRILRPPLPGGTISDGEILDRLLREGQPAAMRDLWKLLLLQGSGEEGLLVIGRENIIHPVTSEGPRIVSARFRPDGWWFCAHRRGSAWEAECSTGRHEGDQVLYREMSWAQADRLGHLGHF